MALWLTGVTKQDAGYAPLPFTGGPPKIVLHTTECVNRPNYTPGTHPHLDIRWTGTALDVRQYISLDVAARALVNKAGGVETNRDGAIQIELIGTCDTRRTDGAFRWYTASDVVLKQLGLFLRRLAAATKVPLVVGLPWIGYPSLGDKARWTLPQWDNFAGICGHEHVPENDHKDPGFLNVQRALILSAPPAPTTTPPVRTAVPVPKPVPVSPLPPPFPLPAGHWYGTPSSDSHNHSGYYSTLDRNGIRVFQTQMKRRGWTINVDGLFSPQTDKVVRAFQTEKHLGTDGHVGPVTWRAAWTLTR